MSLWLQYIDYSKSQGSAKLTGKLYGEYSFCLLWLIQGAAKVSFFDRVVDSCCAV